MGLQKSNIFGLNFGHLTTSLLETVSRNITRQFKLNVGSMEAFKKCMYNGSPQGCPL